MATLVTYSLLILDVLVLALLLQLVLFGPVWLLRRRRSAPASSSAPAGFTDGFGTAARKRRCDDCRSGWIGQPGTDASTLVLRLRRSARRRAKAGGRPAPSWAAKQGWDRCPSCFSTNVRDSRRQVEVGR